MSMTASDSIGAMLAPLTKKWWVFLAQGIVMIILAYLAFSQPDLLLRFIGAYAVIDGALKLFSGLSAQPNDQSRWPALIIGGLSILVGAIVWTNPGLAAQVITYLIAAWAIVIGGLLILWGVRLRDAISDEWLLIILGILSLAFGIIVFGNVQVGYFTLQFIFAAYMIVGGIVAILLSFRIRSLGVRLGAVS